MTNSKGGFMKTLGELVVSLAPLNDAEKELVGMVQKLVDEINDMQNCEDNCKKCMKHAAKLIEQIGALS